MHSLLEQYLGSVLAFVYSERINLSFSFLSGFLLYVFSRLFFSGHFSFLCAHVCVGVCACLLILVSIVYDYN